MPFPFFLKDSLTSGILISLSLSFYLDDEDFSCPLSFPFLKGGLISGILVSLFASYSRLLLFSFLKDSSFACLLLLSFRLYNKQFSYSCKYKFICTILSNCIFKSFYTFFACLLLRSSFKDAIAKIAYILINFKTLKLIKNASFLI